MKKIGILTSGGDCQGLNAAIRALGKGLYNEFGQVRLYGIEDGYSGLIEGKVRILEPKDLSGILTLGGTILGTSRRPFKKISENDVEAMLENYKKWELDCLCVMGGNGTHKTSNLLRENGLNVVSLPKTIDNDIVGTDITFGFHSACDVAAEVIDRIHTTADSHGRVFIVEVMGHKVGWLTLYAGIAASADVILLPEIPYNIHSIAEYIRKREKEGKDFTIIAAAEGALSTEETALKKKELKEVRKAYPSIAYKLMDELKNETRREVRIAIPGHIQRGGSPNSYDRVLCTRLGSAAARFIKEEKFGVMAAVRNGHIVPVPLEETAGKLKSVPVDCEEIRQAREIGISFGDN